MYQVTVLSFPSSLSHQHKSAIERRCQLPTCLRPTTSTSDVFRVGLAPDVRCDRFVSIPTEATLSVLAASFPDLEFYTLDAIFGKIVLFSRRCRANFSK